MLFVLYACGGEDSVESEVTIVFESNGGSVLDPEVIIINNPPSALSEPSRDGYAFRGWYFDDEFIESFDFDDLEDIEEVTLYARWEAISVDDDPEIYTVYIDFQDGNDLVTVDVEAGETLDAPTVNERSGFVFEGWYEDAAFATAYDFSAPVDESLTVYAKWLAYYVVDYYVDGDAVDSETVLHGEFTQGTLDPEKTGYTFDGWYIGDSFIESLAFDESDPITSDLALHAKFSQNTYTITFEAGEYSVDPQDVLYDSAFSLPDLEASEPFLGWYLEDTFETPFFPGDMPAEDITLYAAFGETYTVSYYQDDTLFYDRSVPGGQGLVFPDNDPLKEGHTFMGWERFIGDFDYGYLMSEGISVDMHINLRAVFEVNTYTLSFEETTLDFAYGAPLDLDYPDEDALFIGWYKDDAFSEALDYTTMPAHDLAVYPRIAGEAEILSLETVLHFDLPRASVSGDIIHYEYLDTEAKHLYLLRDDTAQMAILLSDPFEIDVEEKNIELKIHLNNEDGVVIIDSVSDVSVLGPMSPLDTTPITTDAFYGLDLDDLTHQATTYTTEGFVVVEGDMVFLYDLINEMAYPIINMSSSSAYQGLLDSLDHPYVEFSFTVIQGELGPFLVYLPSQGTMESVVLSDSEKLTILSDVLVTIMDEEVFAVGDAFGFGGSEPFFGSSLSAMIIGDNAHYYDAIDDVFLYTEEDVTIDIEVTLTLGSETSTFTTTILLAGLDSDAFSDITTSGDYTLEGSILYNDGTYVLLSDGNDYLWLMAQNASDYQVGRVYSVPVSITHQGRITSGFVGTPLHDHGESTLTITPTPSTINALYTQDSDTELVLYETFEGVILSSDDFTYPYILSDGTHFIYLENHSDFEAALGEKVSVDLFITDYLTYGQQEGYTGTYSDALNTVEVLPFDILEQMHFSEALLQAYYHDVYRPGRSYLFPLNFDDLGHTIEYTLSGGQASYVTMDENGELTLSFSEAGIYQLTIEIDVNGLKYTINRAFIVEDYVISTIEDALEDETNQSHTFEVKVDGFTREYDMVVTDGTGSLILSGHGFDEYLPLGSTLIVSGNPLYQDYNTEVQNPIYEESTTAFIPDPAITVVTFETLQGYNEPYEGLLHIEIEGTLAFPTDGFDMSIVHSDGSFYTIGRDPSDGTWFDYLDETVVIRGYFMYSTTLNENVIVISEVISVVN